MLDPSGEHIMNTADGNVNMQLFLAEWQEMRLVAVQLH